VVRAEPLAAPWAGLRRDGLPPSIERGPTTIADQRCALLHFKGRALCADGSLTAASCSSTVRTS
jgi:hypothetical protein